MCLLIVVETAYYGPLICECVCVWHHGFVAYSSCRVGFETGRETAGINSASICVELQIFCTDSLRPYLESLIIVHAILR